jgi:hypothetical protein
VSLIIQHKERAKLTTMAGRNSTTMVAQLFGVSPARVREWIVDGQLNARCRVQASGRNYWVIDDDSLFLFLRTHGAIRILHPMNAEWKDHVKRGRGIFHRDHIALKSIAALLYIPPEHVTWLKRRRDFPGPAYYFHPRHSNEGGEYFTKRAIIEWLRMHEGYDPRGSVRRKLTGIS